MTCIYAQSYGEEKVGKKHKTSLLLWRKLHWKSLYKTHQDYFSSFTELCLTNKNRTYLRCTPWCFDKYIYWAMITTIKLINVCITSHNTPFVWVYGIQYLSKFQTTIIIHNSHQAAHYTFRTYSAYNWKPGPFDTGHDYCHHHHH